MSESLHLVASTATPSVKLALEELTNTLGDISQWVALAQENERTQLCLWPGQSDDFRKWDRNFEHPVAPYDGCADTRNRLVDASMAELCQLQVLAFFKANPTCAQQEAGDASAAGKVSTLLKYEVRQRMLSQSWDEVNFLCAWKEMFGSAVMQVLWEKDVTTGLQKITPQELADWLAMEQAKQNEQLGMGDAQEIAPVLTETMNQVVLEALTDSDLAQAVEIIRARFPTLSDKRAKAVVQQLRKGESAEFRLPVNKPGRPRMKARCPGIDVFYPWWTPRCQEAPWVAVVDTLSEVELRKLERTEDVSEEFITQMIAVGPMPAMEVGSMPVVNQSSTDKHPFFDNATKKARRRVEELRRAFQIVRFYLKAVDEDGFECTHEIICHPSIGLEKDGKMLIGKHRVVDHWFDACDFVSVRREYTTRPLWESRGVPEIAGGTQWELKKWRDQMLNRNDLAVDPPVFTTYRNAAGKGPRLGIRPGATLKGERGDEARYMDAPRLDGFGSETERMIRAENANLLGLQHELVPQSKTMSHQQYMVTGFLIQMREVLQRILALDQQFMEPIFVERVVGGGGQPFAVTREEIAGQFDIQLNFDVLMMDPEYVKARWNVIREAMANDRSGVMRDYVFTRWLVTSIDPTLADVGFDDPQGAIEKDLNDLHGLLSNAMNGFYGKPKDGGNAQAQLQDLDQQLTSNPGMFQMYQGNETFREYVDALRRKFIYDLQQFDNAEKGRSGWTFDDAGDRAGVGRGEPTPVLS